MNLRAFSVIIAILLISFSLSASETYQSWLAVIYNSTAVFPDSGARMKICTIFVGDGYKTEKEALQAAENNAEELVTELNQQVMQEIGAQDFLACNHYSFSSREKNCFLPLFRVKFTEKTTETEIFDFLSVIFDEKNENRILTFRTEKEAVNYAKNSEFVKKVIQTEKQWLITNSTLTEDKIQISENFSARKLISE